MPKPQKLCQEIRRGQTATHEPLGLNSANEGAVLIRSLGEIIGTLREYS